MQQIALDLASDLLPRITTVHIDVEALRGDGTVEWSRALDLKDTAAAATPRAPGDAADAAIDGGQGLGGSQAAHETGAATPAAMVPAAAAGGAVGPCGWPQGAPPPALLMVVNPADYLTDLASAAAGDEAAARRYQVETCGARRDVAIGATGAPYRSLVFATRIDAPAACSTEPPATSGSARLPSRRAMRLARTARAARAGASVPPSTILPATPAGQRVRISADGLQSLPPLPRLPTLSWRELVLGAMYGLRGGTTRGNATWREDEHGNENDGTNEPAAAPTPPSDRHRCGGGGGNAAQRYGARVAPHHAAFELAPPSRSDGGGGGGGGGGGSRGLEAPSSAAAAAAVAELASLPPSPSPPADEHGGIQDRPWGASRIEVSACASPNELLSC